MLADYRKLISQEDIDQCFDNYLRFGVAGVKTDKDGNTTIASPDEILDVLLTGKVELKELHYNLFERYGIQKGKAGCVLSPEVWARHGA